jgi:hypothetical protein
VNKKLGLVTWGSGKRQKVQRRETEFRRNKGTEAGEKEFGARKDSGNEGDRGMGRAEWGSRRQTTDKRRKKKGGGTKKLRIVECGINN